MKLFRALTYGIVSLTSLSVAAQTPPAKHITDSVVPGAEWVTAAPESVGYSSARLEALRGWVKTQDTGSMMVIVQGRVIFSYGDVSHTSKIASVRKSVLNMLYGADVFKDQIKDDALNKTVRQLGLDDKVPFLPMEENATLIELMGSRSGIYIPTGNDGQAKTMPPRGSELPGAHFIYNNWDFDAAGTAFEKLAGRDIFKALQDDLAKPLGMQDFVLGQQKKNYAPESVPPEFAMYLSTRDMARLGLLMLDCGQWNGKTVISCDWARYSTYVATQFRDINPTGFRNYGEPERWGYGLLWWVWDEQMFLGNAYIGFMQGAYTAAGTGGTYITVLPANGMVVVHQVDIDKNYRAYVSPSSYMAMLSMLANSWCGDECK
ncbi:serine hydrolase domain-containing protein [Tunturiibacter gelidoferens]|uniref:CubicO group peptidase (Beta-lactamase class C family) n=1 Tax=Tunturiibacter lichenicola TaxID=2051959 RepID=A0A7Y9NLR0_9BACT|nr:serine hydrolase [Edaphobacter lichenicola]NYF51648.1 CubicO group peptidase (beta-lactamase class C family) [Edaphobacter lichenicola]